MVVLTNKIISSISCSIGRVVDHLVYVCRLWSESIVHVDVSGTWCVVIFCIHLLADVACSRL